MTAAPEKFPPGGLTPVFNEITALLTISPQRPSVDTRFEDLPGPKERLLMKNVVNEGGIVEPSIFIRSNTFADPHTGLATQVLGLAACSGIAKSQLLGAEVAVHVKSAAEALGLIPANLPPGARQALDAPLSGGRAVTPEQPSIGKIQAVSSKSEFPARVTMKVYYSFVVGVRDGKLSNVSETFSVEGHEPHHMEATVMSIPPDPGTPLVGREWDLFSPQSDLLKLWTRIESFRFLGWGDWQHTERIAFAG